MLLKGAEIARYLARPDPSRPGVLIYGQDAMRVAMIRHPCGAWIQLPWPWQNHPARHYMDPEDADPRTRRATP